MIRIGVLGNGLMGQLVAEEITAAKDDCMLAGVATRDLDSARRLIAESHIVIDFTAPEATPDFAHAAAECNTPFMSGTTGLSPERMESLKRSSRRIPIFYAPNTSRSFAQFSRRMEQVTRELSDSFHAVEIIDEHHSGKKDRPSGSALLLGEAIREASGGRLQVSFRPLRQGDAVGKHTVAFTGDGEAQSYCHEITDRRVFARGAVSAALWFYKKGPGLYGMNDMLRL